MTASPADRPPVYERQSVSSKPSPARPDLWLQQMLTGKMPMDGDESGAVCNESAQALLHPSVLILPCARLESWTHGDAEVLPARMLPRSSTVTVDSSGQGQPPSPLVMRRRDAESTE